MPEITVSRPSPRTTVAVIKAGPVFQAWFQRFREHLRFPVALLLDAALVEFARARDFEEPPQRWQVLLRGGGYWGLPVPS